MSETFEFTFYMIHHKNTDKVQIYDETIREHYIGSTRNPDKRFGEHKHNCNKPDRDRYNLKVYQHIRDNGGFGEWQISILETHTVTKKDASIHERWLIELYESNLNTQVPSRTAKEYYSSRRDEIIEQQRAYRTSNRDHINEQQRDYREANRKLVNERQRAYCAAKRDLINERQRAYRAAKKDLSVNIGK